ncbi:MAG: chemotaxis protein CheW [Acidiferrobacter sp.]
MKTSNLVVGLMLGGQRYALYLAQVERVIRAVEVVLLPEAPGIIAGVINVQGQVIPVINIRRRFRLPEREMALSDHMIVARTARRKVALLVDGAMGVIELSQDQVVRAPFILPDMEYVEGVVKLEDGLILIHNLDTFLALEEENALDHALSDPAGRPQ